MGPGGENDVMHRKRARRIWGIWEKSVSWVLASEEDSLLSGLTEIRPVVGGGVPHVVEGGRWKSHHRKIVYLSPYLEKPFNSKVIKSFVPEQRSRKCFCVSGFLYALWTFYVFFTYSCMAMLHPHVHPLTHTHTHTQIHTHSYIYTYIYIYIYICIYMQPFLFLPCIIE